MRTLNEDLKNKTWRSVYLLFGDEAYLKQFYFGKLRDAIGQGDTMNTMVLEGQEFDLQKAREFTDTMPFFAEKRLLILRETGLFSKSSEGVAEWLDSLPETACVLFTEESVDKRNKVYKKVQEKGYAAELLHPDEKAFSGWLLNRIGKSSLSVTRDAFDSLMELLPRDMELAIAETDKLFAYCLSEGSIQKKDVELMLTPRAENRIFDMVEAVAQGNRQQALKYYYDLLALQEAPLRILFLLGRHYGQLAMIKGLAQNGKRREEVASIMGLKPFIAGKLMDQCRRFPIETLEKAVEQAVSLEAAVKSGNLTDRLAAELFIFGQTGRRESR